MTAGALKLECVAQDSRRVRASAGAASFRRKASLQDNLELARDQVRELQEQIDADPAHEAKALHKRRAATAECVTAQARNRGLQRMSGRGLTRCAGRQ